MRGFRLEDTQLEFVVPGFRVSQFPVCSGRGRGELELFGPIDKSAASRLLVPSCIAAALKGLRTVKDHSLELKCFFMCCGDASFAASVSSM